MNRQQRRAADALRKLARNASDAEIFPAQHGPVQSNLVDLMRVAVDALREQLGKNFDVTLFITERVPTDGSDRLPRFNYMSTAAREDMVAVLNAFAAKNAALGPKLDKIDEAPPTGTAQ
jgi:hypothetical protein